MLTIRVPTDVRETITSACQKAGVEETGGMLFGEHVADAEFRVIEATVAGTGSFATFFRGLREGLARLERFFRQTQRNYERFNYLGEWHSHPSFALIPSAKDDESMFAIVRDPRTGARFAVALIVQISDATLDGAAFAYFRDGERENCSVLFERY